MKDPSVTVVVPVRDRADLLRQLLESVEAAARAAMAGHPTSVVKLIVVDDRSERIPEVPSGLEARLIAASGQGPGAARNTGAWAADTDWLLFTDSDCAVDADWISAAVRHVDGSEESVVQGDPTRYTRSTPFGALEEALYGHMYSKYIATDGAHTSMLDSRNLLIRRDALLDVGGFDVAGLDAMAESRVLAARLAKAGFAFRYDEHMVVRHQAARSLEQEMGAKFRHGRGRVSVWGAKPPSESEMALRYFIGPVNHGIDPDYVIPVHLAFLGGYSHQASSDSRKLPRTMVEAIACMHHNHESATRLALNWLAEQDRQ